MMLKKTGKAIRIFLSYAYEDQELKDHLEKHLSFLKRKGLIETWNNRDINAGQEWKIQASQHLTNANIILLLISPDFMASDYCYSSEMKEAMKLHEKRQAYVIPIILRHVYWHNELFSKLKVLPYNRKPIRSWPDLDEAFLEVVKEIQTTIVNILKEQHLEDTEDLYQQSEEIEATTDYSQAIRLDPNDAGIYYKKGNAHFNIGQYKEAIAAYDQAIRLDPNDAGIYYKKGNALLETEKYKEAIAAYDQAIRLDPNHTSAYNNKGCALNNLGLPLEAIKALDKAIRLNPKDGQIYLNKSNTLFKLGKIDEGLRYHQKAIKLLYKI